MASIQVYPYLSPRIIEILSPAIEITIQELVDLCRDWEDEDDNMSFEYLIDAAGKEDLGGGVSVGITATLNNAQIYFTERSTPIDDGTGRTCDATDTDGRQLYVDDATFVTDGVGRGDVVYNTSTGSMATILEVVDENTLDHFQLSGGASIAWTSGDNYTVYDQVQCNISGGNLVAVDDVGDILAPVLESPLTQVIRTSSSSATLTETEELKTLTYGGVISLDTASSITGTEFPAGNLSNPVNNIADATTLLTEKGFSEIVIRGSITLTQSYNNIVFRSFGGHTSENIDINNQNVMGCSFINLNITGGMLGSGIGFDACNLVDISGYDGDASNCGISGTITFATGCTAIFNNCRSNVPGTSTPIFDVNSGANSSIQFRGHIGGAEVRNHDQATNVSSFDIITGNFIIASTCTNGTMVLRGGTDHTNNGGGSLVLVIDGLYNRLIWNDNISGSTDPNSAEYKLEKAQGWSEIAVKGVS